ncbi:MAG: mechanosensitive ion channel family protein [Alphaproteobacteria bacterium]
MENQEITKIITEAVYNAISERLIVQSLITSLLIIAGFILLRFVLARLIRGKNEFLDKDQRRWINRINNTASISIVISLILIWAPQLHTFALSLTAVAVAIVLTTKELLMCFTGGFLRASSKPFDVGDWITVDGITGEAMKISATKTLIEKIDTDNRSYEFTGETVQIPNSRFLTASVQNANFTRKYIYYDVPITMQFNDLEPDVLMQELKRIACEYFEPFRDAAERYNRRIEKKAAVDFADPDPRFFMHTTELGLHVYTVRMFLPTHEALKTGTLITQEFLTFAHHLRVDSVKN